MIEDPILYCPHCGIPLVEQLHSGKLRPSCTNCGWVYFHDPKVAVAVLLKKDNQVLLVQRRYDPQKGRWTLPSGFVDAGEDPKSAAERECLEETGFVIGDVHLIDVIFSHEHPRGASILILYKAIIVSGALSAGDDASQVSYFDMTDLPPLAFASTRQIIESL